MDFSATPENLQTLIVWSILAFLLGFRFYRFRRAKKLIGPLMAQGALVVDVRNPNEFAKAHSAGSLNIPLDEISTAITKAPLKDIDKARPIILCCATGARSSMAMRVLRNFGFYNVVNAGSWKNTLDSTKSLV